MAVGSQTQCAGQLGAPASSHRVTRQCPLSSQTSSLVHAVVGHFGPQTVGGVKHAGSGMAATRCTGQHTSPPLQLESSEHDM
jgi:hypothetical protein